MAALAPVADQGRHSAREDQVTQVGIEAGLVAVAQLWGLAAPAGPGQLGAQGDGLPGISGAAAGKRLLYLAHGARCRLDDLFEVRLPGGAPIRWSRAGQGWGRGR